MAPRRAVMILVLAAVVSVAVQGAVAQDSPSSTPPSPEPPVPVLQNTENRINVSNQKLRCLYLPGVKAADTPPPTHIDASNNLLTDINDNVLHGLYLLRSLNLSGNLMHEWGRYPFRDLRSLEVLDVSRNQFRNVDRVVLEPLQALRRLNLSGNRITYIDTAAFPAMERLLDLDLTRNDMEVIADDAFLRLPGLQRLDLRFNRLATLGERTLRGLTAVQTVLLGGNIISEAVPGALQGLNSLSEISLADNQQAVDLVLVGNRLQRVDLSRLGLSAVPAALTRSVRVLLLPGNNLRIISCGDLDSFPLLQALELSNNGLALVEDDALGRLEQLETLILKNNSLMMIPPSLPGSLVTLQLQSNQIRYIGANDLRGLRRLERLDLSHNQVHHIHDGAFRFLENLQELDLSGNDLLELRAAALAGPVALQSLRLVHLPEIVAPAKWLPFPVVRPERLQHLDLDQSPQLARQLLADTAALMAMPHLQVLRLGSAELHHLRSDLPRLLSHLKHLRLIDNPWNCAGLRWLPRWLRHLDAESGAGATCRQPAQLAGLQLRNLTDAHFNSSQTESDEAEEEDPPPPLALPLGDHRLAEDEVALADEEVSIPINEYKRIMIELNKTLAREAAAKEGTTGTPVPTANPTSPVAARSTEPPATPPPPPVAAALSATINPDSALTPSVNTPSQVPDIPTTSQPTTTRSSKEGAPPASSTLTASHSSTLPPQAAAQVQLTTGAPVPPSTAGPSTTSPRPTPPPIPATTASTTPEPSRHPPTSTSTKSPPSTAITLIPSTSSPPAASTPIRPSSSTSPKPPSTSPPSQSSTSTPAPGKSSPPPPSTSTTSSGKGTSSPPVDRVAVNAVAAVTAAMDVVLVANHTAASLRHVPEDSSTRLPDVEHRHTTSVVAMFAVAVCCSVAVLLAFAIARNSRQRRQQLVRLHSMEDLVLRGRGPDAGLDGGPDGGPWPGSDCHCDPRRDAAGPELW